MGAVTLSPMRYIFGIQGAIDLPRIGFPVMPRTNLFTMAYAKMPEDARPPPAPLDPLHLWHMPLSLPPAVEGSPTRNWWIVARHSASAQG